jgi:negative regulator of flagellin synthesis FlgM
MTDIVSSTSSARIDRPDRPRVAIDRTTPGADAQPRQRPSDLVELSDRARYLARLQEIPAVRNDLITRIREQIEEGSYDTAERIEAAVRALADELADTGDHQPDDGEPI